MHYEAENRWDLVKHKTTQCMSPPKLGKWSRDVLKFCVDVVADKEREDACGRFYHMGYGYRKKLYGMHSSCLTKCKRFPSHKRIKSHSHIIYHYSPVISQLGWNLLLPSNCHLPLQR